MAVTLGPRQPAEIVPQPLSRVALGAIRGFRSAETEEPRDRQGTALAVRPQQEPPSRSSAVMLSDWDAEAPSSVATATASAAAFWRTGTLARTRRADCWPPQDGRGSGA
jgi:hypothetical protein